MLFWYDIHGTELIDLSGVLALDSQTSNYIHLLEYLFVILFYTLHTIINFYRKFYTFTILHRVHFSK